jgi:glycosyltransferase involved in cell wall biosynthesis
MSPAGMGFMQRMRDAMQPVVMHVIYALEHGGTERFLCGLLNHLAGGPVRHVLCTLRGAGARVAELDPRIPVVALGEQTRMRWGFVHLARAIRRHQASLVHARNLGTWSDTLLACRFVRGARPVLAFHGALDSPPIPPRLARRLRYLGAGQAALTTVSYAGQAQLGAALGADAKRIAVLPNGVNLNRFRPPRPADREAARLRWGIARSTRVIATVGNLFAPVKGHHVLVDAFAELNKDHPRTMLLIAGFGPLRDRLRRQADAHGLGERVRLLGAIEDTPSLLAASDVYACPSLSEGMSNALLEALATGLPCVATDVGDHRRMLTGELPDVDLPPPGDVSALARALDRVLTDDATRVAWSTAGRRLVQRDFALDEAFARYARFYQSLAPVRELARAVSRASVQAEVNPCHP